MKLTHIAVIFAVIIVFISVVYATDYVKGDLKPRSYFFKRIHAQIDKPRVVISASAATTIYGFTAEEYLNYKSKKAFETVPELTKFGANYLSQIVPSKYSELVIVIENRDYTNELHFSITIMKATDPVANTLSIVESDDDAATVSSSDADVSISTGSASSSSTSDNNLDASINSPFLPHLTNAHMAQVALCAFASRFHFPLCHHVVKHTLSGEGYEAIPQAAFTQDSDVHSTLAADSSTTTTTSATTDAKPTSIIVNVSSGDTTIFVVLLVVIVLMWAALLAIIVKLGKDGQLSPELGSASYQKVSSVN